MFIGVPSDKEYDNIGVGVLSRGFLKKVLEIFKIVVMGLENADMTAFLWPNHQKDVAVRYLFQYQK